MTLPDLVTTFYASTTGSHQSIRGRSPIGFVSAQNPREGFAPIEASKAKQDLTAIRTDVSTGAYSYASPLALCGPRCSIVNVLAGV